jgi:hypothetical protein
MAEELGRRIKEGAIPIISDVEGFMAYQFGFGPGEAMLATPRDFDRNLLVATTATTGTTNRHLQRYLAPRQQA